MAFVLNLARTATRMIFLTLSSCLPHEKDAVDGKVPVYREIPLTGATNHFEHNLAPKETVDVEVEKLGSRVHHQLHIRSPKTSHPCDLKSRTGFASEEGKKCLEWMKPLYCVLEKVHAQVTMNEIELKGPLNDRKMLAAIAKFTNHKIAKRTLSCLKAIWKGTRITRFRSSVVYALISPEIYCPVVEWIENDDTEVVAFFNIGGQNEYSWLAHYQKVNREEGQRRLSRTYVKFCAEAMGYLKVLFEAAQHLSGVLAWDTKDILRLYCRLQPHEAETPEE